METDPSKRLSATQALRHDWLDLGNKYLNDTGFELGVLGSG